MAPSNAKWMVRAAADTMMTSQRKSELDMVGELCTSPFNHNRLRYTKGVTGVICAASLA